MSGLDCCCLKKPIITNQTVRQTCQTLNLVERVAVPLWKCSHCVTCWRDANPLWHPSRSPLPQTAGEWAQVLQLQRQFHQAQLNKWQQILQSSVTLLDQVGDTLCVCVYACVCVCECVCVCQSLSVVSCVRVEVSSCQSAGKLMSHPKLSPHHNMM